jgi:hypothetical protein
MAFRHAPKGSSVALTDAAVVIPGTGHIYLAPSGTAIPGSLTSPASPWDELGHTSRDDGLTITRDGGDSEVLGTWQNASLRQRVDPTTFAITMTAHQVDNTVLGLYFGGGDTSVANVFGVTSAVGTTEKALFVRIIDGTNELNLHLAKVSITSDDDMEIDPEGFLSFPLRATVLQQSGQNLMDWIADNLGA